MLQSRFWQAFFAIVPLAIFFVAIIFYFVFIFTILAQIPELESSGEPSFAILGGVGIFVVAIMIGALLSIGSLVYYIVHAVKNPNLKENNLLLVWILLFVFANGIGQLIYWLVEVLGKKNDGQVALS